MLNTNLKKRPEQNLRQNYFSLTEEYSYRPMLIKVYTAGITAHMSHAFLGFRSIFLHFIHTTTVIVIGL